MSIEARKIRLLMNLRRSGITDNKVLSAIERIPREEFVDPNFTDQAYEDRALPIAAGQTISQPLIVALMTQALNLSDRQRVLEVGTGSGYQAAILSRLCRRVYTIERHKELADLAQRRFAAVHLHNITTKIGDGSQGWPEQAPFDRIIVTAAAWAEPPPALIEQLKEGGLMVVPIASSHDDQTLVRLLKTSTGFKSEDLCPVRFVPLISDTQISTNEAV